MHREHPAAAIFPLMSGTDFDELVADVKANGLRDPITTYRDTILDGRNRLRACEAAGIEPRFKEWTGDDPIAFVISCNLHRRHLNTTQRAAIAVKLANMRQGERSDLQPCSPVYKVSTSQAADLLQVSRQSAWNAKAIFDHGTPEQVKAMERGTLRLRPTAEKLRRATREKPRRGLRRDRTAPYKPETQGQRERAQAQKDRMVTSLSTIKGHCRGLSEFDIGMAKAACSAEDLKTWSKLARENARVLTAFALFLEKGFSNGIKAA